MRVLLVPYPPGESVVGGHVTQQTETAAALRRLGLEVEIGSIDDVPTANVDVVHAFHDVRPLLERGRPAAKLVVSPIYVPKKVLLGPARHRGGQPHMLEARIRHGARVVRHATERRHRANDLRATLEAWREADMIVVNSKAEGRLLQRDAPGLKALRVAYSGVAHESFTGDPAEGRRILGIGDEAFVLSVARLEPWKNQMSLALAMRGLPVRLVLVGGVNPGNEDWLAAVQAVAPDVHHVPHIDHALIPHAHAAARVHALPSWYETTGLSTLEALAAARPVVVGRGPCVEEYFSGCAHFCDAGSIRSIRRAVVRALEGPVGCEQDVARRFSWDRTAQELVAAYRSVTDAV